LAKKKNKAVLVVQEDDMVQAQPLLDQYHEIAGELHRSFSVDQAEPALTNINNLPEAAQVALLKALAKKQHVDAADVLLAINELSPLKNIRKEARRALIHMEEARIYPGWHMPIQQTSPYRIVAPSFRSTDEAMPLADFEDGFDEDEDEDEFDDYDEEDDVDFHDLSPQDVVGTFVRLWVKGRFLSAYSLLTEDSPLRGGFVIDEWVERRKAWADEAKPDRYTLEAGLIHERTAQETELWLPDEVSVDPATLLPATTSKTIVLDWSMVFTDVSSSETLPELPHATLVYDKTGRHWFWSSYVLIEQEDSSWLIHSMTDEGLNALHLPATVLRERIEAHKNFLNALRQEVKPTKLEDVKPYVDVSLWRMIQTFYYYDALIAQLPQERSLYEEIATRALSGFQYERCMAYMELMVERFSEERAATLRLLASIQRQYSDICFEEGDDDRAFRFLELAKEALRESLAIENTFAAHVVLAELLTEDMEDHLDEAEEYLQEAKALSSGPADEANIEIHLGKIDTEREQDEEALLHFQRATELEPNLAPAWFNLAGAYSRLENVEDAKKSYQRAIELQPDNVNLYMLLSFLYNKPEHQDDMAIEVLKEGLSANPDSVELCIALSTFYMTIDDYEQAEEFLDKAEQIDPDAVMVEMMRPMLKSMRTLYRAKPAGQNVDEAKPARRVVESIAGDNERASKPFQPSHPKKKKRKKR